MRVKKKKKQKINKDNNYYCELLNIFVVDEILRNY